MEKTNFLKRIKGMREFSILAIGIIFIILLSIVEPKFISGTNISNLIRQTAITGVIAIGMTFVIISGGIDLSVGSILAFTGVAVAVFMQKGYSIFTAIILSVLVSVLIGVVIGELIHRGKIPPFIATLGAMQIVRGMVMLWSKANQIPVPKSVSVFATAKFFGIPAMAFVWFGIIILGLLVSKYTVFGRNVYAIGSNVEAARLSGINVEITTVGIYVFCAFCSAIAGLLMVTRLGSANPTAGVGIEMDAIAACVVGGASLMGAVGSVFGTVIGTIIIAMIRNGGQLLKINSFVLDIIVGALIVVAVLIDKLHESSK
jgi:ribose transport system permease protein